MVYPNTARWRKANGPALLSGRRSTRRRPPLRKVRCPATFDAALRFLADHPDPAAVVECTLPDGSQGWVPASVADLVEAMPPENAARLRRLLGELLPALWEEGMRRRVDGTVGPLDSFARAAPPDVAARWAAKHRR